MSQQFWNALSTIGPIGILLILGLVVFLKMGPSFVAAMRTAKEAPTSQFTSQKAGDDSIEAWVLRNEASMRKVLAEMLRDRDIHVKQIVDSSLEVFLERIKRELK